MSTGTNGKKGSEQGGEVTTLRKTELKNVKDVRPDGDTGPKVMHPNQVMGIMADMAKRAALTMIKEDLELYKGLIKDSKKLSDKLEIMREISDLKLRSAGICLAGMRLTGQIEVPGDETKPADV